MERPGEGGPGTQASRARHSGSTQGSFRSVRTQHVIKEEPEEETAQRWETQWQDFLSAMDNPLSPPQDPHVPPEPTPWDDAEAFLTSFERVAEACHWPREEWVDRLRPALTGEVELTFSSLEAGEKRDYGKVKAAILQEDVLGREKSRQRFRSFCYLEAEGPRGLYSHLWELCSRWLKVEKHSKEQILEELVLEQFLAVLPPEIHSWVKEHPLESSTQAVSLAEEFLRSQWVPMVKEEQLTAQVHGGGPAHLREGRRLPQHAGVGPRLLRESKTEELTDVSDADLSADGGETYEDSESPPEESSRPRAPLRISLGRASGDGSEVSSQRNGHRKGRSSGKFTTESGQDLICQEPRKDTRKNICSVCGKSFTREWTLKQHKQSHHLSHSPEETRQGFLAREGHRDRTDVESRQSVASRERPCVCPHCGESFSSVSLLVAHQRTHVGDLWPPSYPEVTLYICRECGETFDSLQDHDSHQETHSSQTPRAILERETEQPSSLTKPPRPQAEEQTYECADCGKSFVSMLWYKKHQMRHKRKKQAYFFYNPKKKTCSICGLSFPNCWKLRQHQRSHPQMNPDRGSRYSERVKRNEDLIESASAPKLHKAAPPTERGTDAEKRHFLCSQCGRRFLKLANLVRHQSVHSTLKRYTCTHCGERFVRKSSLCDHKKRCHGGKKLAPGLARKRLTKGAPGLAQKPLTKGAPGLAQKPLTKGAPGLAQKPLTKGAPGLAQKRLTKGLSDPCPDCGKIYCSTSSMERHRRMHSGEKFYRCPDCGKSFMWDSTYYNHRRKVHNWQGGAHHAQRGPKVEKAYPCDQCGATFKKASLLSMHRCVQAETQLICGDCGKTFSNPSALERHQKSHQKKMPKFQQKRDPRGRKKAFVCAQCGRCFQFPWHLKMHQVKHLAVKPLKCGDCGERFLWNLCLARHRKKVHGRVKTDSLSPAAPSVHQGVLSRHARGKRFAKKPDLIKHQRVHVAEKSLKLPDLRKRVRGRLDKDRKDQEKPPEGKGSAPTQKEFTCLTCGAHFKSFPELVSHGYLHGEGKLHKCTDCGKNFSQPSSLSRHQKDIHMRKKLVPVLHRIPELEKKTFKCSEYEKRLHPPLDKLRYPAAPEKGEAFTCSQCGEKFTFRTALSRHQAIHREVRRHTCGECGKKFIYLTNLIKHKATHAESEKLTLQRFGSDLQVNRSSSSPQPAATLAHKNSNEASGGPSPGEDLPLDLQD